MADAQASPDAEEQRAPNQSVVSFDNVTKQYGEGEGAVLALDGIDLDLNDNEFLSVVGPSGCGKSTLLHLTSALLEPTSGSVSIEGVNVQSEMHKKHQVGLVFQSSVLLDWKTVLDNVLLPIDIMVKNNALEHDKAYYTERAHELIELVGLDGFKDAYPQELSGGMQQRVSICRSLVYDPPVLLMDEPFGALDALTRNKMNKELLRIWKETEKTIVFVTHNLDEAVFLSDRVAVMSARPGEIQDVVDIDLPRPRNADTRKTDEYRDLVSDMYGHFE